CNVCVSPLPRMRRMGLRALLTLDSSKQPASQQRLHVILQEFGVKANLGPEIPRSGRFPRDGQHGSVLSKVKNGSAYSLESCAMDAKVSMVARARTIPSSSLKVLASAATWAGVPTNAGMTLTCSAQKSTSLRPARSGSSSPDSRTRVLSRREK